MELLTKEHFLKYGAKDVSSQNRIRFAFVFEEITLYVNYDKVQNNWWFEVEDKNSVVWPQKPMIKSVEELKKFYKEFTGNELIRYMIWKISG